MSRCFTCIIIHDTVTGAQYLTVSLHTVLFLYRSLTILTCTSSLGAALGAHSPKVCIPEYCCSIGQNGTSTQVLHARSF